MIAIFLKYQPKKADELCKLIGEGYSPVEACREINISLSDLENWRNLNEEFQKKYLKSLDDSLGWYDKQARENFGNKNFNTTLYVKMRDLRFKEKIQALEGIEKNKSLKEKAELILDSYLENKISYQLAEEFFNLVRIYQTCYSIEEIKVRLSLLENSNELK